MPTAEFVSAVATGTSGGSRLEVISQALAIDSAFSSHGHRSVFGNDAAAMADSTSAAVDAFFAGLDSTSPALILS